MKFKLLLIAINCLIFLIILFYGLWPLDFNPENLVSRLHYGKGLVMHDNVLIYEPLDSNCDSISSYLDDYGMMTIEILLKPFAEKSSRLSCILCLYDDKEPEFFTLAKWKSDLILRRRIMQQSGSYIYHEIGIADALLPDKNSYIAIATGREGTTIYIDGKKSAFYPGYILNSDKGYPIKTHLILGNEPGGKMPWNGEIKGLAIYKSELKSNDIYRHYLKWLNLDYKLLSIENGIIALYPMNEDSGSFLKNLITDKNYLFIPKNINAVKKTILRSPLHYFREKRMVRKDVFLNIIAFIPLGFFLLVFLASHYNNYTTLFPVITILYGSTLSLTIELMQVFMPHRSSDLMDLMSNTSGTIIGVALFHIIYNTHIVPKK